MVNINIMVQHGWLKITEWYTFSAYESSMSYLKSVDVSESDDASGSAFVWLYSHVQIQISFDSILVP